MLAFGPIPSRRLGKSLGINNIPAKICTYSCVYCQVGTTTKICLERQAFHSPKEIYVHVKKKVSEAKKKNERIDYATFVPDGEPTLDVNLSKEIELIRQLNIPIAVLTNASLIWREDVRHDLLKTDFVSLKVDAISEDLWKRINHPSRSLKLERILDGIAEFTRNFQGTIVTETMLIDGVDYEDEFEKIASFLAEIRLDKAYVAIPTRPPAQEWVKPAREEVINNAFQTFTSKLGKRNVEYLIGYEGDAFASTGKVEEDLLSITSVHPMRERGVRELLRKANADWSIVENLLRDGKLIMLKYEGHRYYNRRLPSRVKRGLHIQRG